MLLIDIVARYVLSVAKFFYSGPFYHLKTWNCAKMIYQPIKLHHHCVITRPVDDTNHVEVICNLEYDWV
jgi:hypothetical protein